MRREWIICIIVIFIVTVTNIITQNYTNKSVEYINDKLGVLKEELMKETVEKEKVEEQIEDITKIWKDKYEKLAYFIEHDELEKAETELTSLSAYINIEEYQEGIPELEKSIFVLNHIKEKFKLNIKNIF